LRSQIFVSSINLKRAERSTIRAYKNELKVGTLNDFSQFNAIDDSIDGIKWEPNLISQTGN